jgi:hypothetical protein
MKYIQIFIILISIAGCVEHTTQTSPNKSCPLPLQFTDPENNPRLDYHEAGMLSSDGKKLFFTIGIGQLKILNLTDLSVQTYNYSKLLPGNMKFVGAGIDQIWCPYDNNKFLSNCLIGVDTIGDGVNFYGGWHIIITSLDEKYFQDITPKFFGPLGAYNGLGAYYWDIISSNLNDNIYISYKLSSNGKNFHQTYNPVTQELKPIQWDGLSSYSNDGKYKFCMMTDYDSLIYTINDKKIIFKDGKTSHLGDGNLSPDGKYLVISANIYGKNRNKDSTDRLSEIWLVDVEQFLQNPVQPVPVKIINIKEKLCMFSDWLFPVFTSNNTLAVTMFKAGDTFEYLYEIDLDGNMVRQLTFTP